MKLRKLVATGGTAAMIAGALVTGAFGDSAATVTGVSVNEGGSIILFEGGVGTAHLVHGVNPGVQAALTALTGRSITVYGTFDNSSPSSSILVNQFVVNPGGALNGQSETMTGPVRMLDDGGAIITDQYGNGHRLYSTSAVSGATIASFANKTVTVTGIADVTNPASYTNWPIEVSSMTASAS